VALCDRWSITADSRDVTVVKMKTMKFDAIYGTRNSFQGNELRQHGRNKLTKSDKPMDSSTNRKGRRNDLGFGFFCYDVEFDPVIPRFSGDIVETIRPGTNFRC
jgi:hypothetical protein